MADLQKETPSYACLARTGQWTRPKSPLVISARSSGSASCSLASLCLELSNRRPGAIKRNSPKILKHAWRALHSKMSLRVPRPEAVLTAKQLQNHFDAFDQMLKQSGIPPIWNGKALVPWKDYHKNSIEFARDCHVQLGIDQPQLQLKGAYSKPVWDPNSQIWQQAD